MLLGHCWLLHTWALYTVDDTAWQELFIDPKKLCLRNLFYANFELIILASWYSRAGGLLICSVANHQGTLHSRVLMSSIFILCKATEHNNWTKCWETTASSFNTGQYNGKVWRCNKLEGFFFPLRLGPESKSKERSGKKSLDPSLDSFTFPAQTLIRVVTTSAPASEEVQHGPH